jgi:hypothetical protein
VGLLAHVVGAQGGRVHQLRGVVGNLGEVGGWLFSSVGAMVLLRRLVVTGWVGVGLGPTNR